MTGSHEGKLERLGRDFNEKRGKSEDWRNFLRLLRGCKSAFAQSGDRLRWRHDNHEGTRHGTAYFEA
jgi:hypothetical protein